MPGSTAVYVDMLFLINLLMDFVVLWAAARLAQIRVSLWRLLAGALIGAIYSILVLLPDLQYMSGIEMKFIISIIMAIVAYLPLSWKKFGRVVLYFYFVAFTMGGAVLGLIYLLEHDIPPRCIFAYDLRLLSPNVKPEPVIFRSLLLPPSVFFHEKSAYSRSFSHAQSIYRELR
jgi:sigma-E processing peptidase SpoIIGA